MKKTIITFAFAILSISVFSQQPSLYFKITDTVYTSDGRMIPSNTVVSFETHPEAIIGNTMPCDLKWWISEAAQDSGYAKIDVITKLYKGQKLSSAYLNITVPVQQFSYSVFQGWAKTWLESYFGAGKVVIIN